MLAPCLCAEYVYAQTLNIAKQNKYTFFGSMPLRWKRICTNSKYRYTKQMYIFYIRGHCDLDLVSPNFIGVNYLL